MSGPQNNHRESEGAGAHAETNPNVNTSEVEQDDEIDDQEDEQDVEYTEDDSNNNPDGLDDRNGDNISRSMPNEIFTDTANATQDGQNAADNHKNSPSDEEFYGGMSTGWFSHDCETK